MRFNPSAFIFGIAASCSILQLHCSLLPTDEAPCTAAAAAPGSCATQNFDLVIDPPAPLIDGNSDQADWPSYGHDLWNTRHNPVEPDRTGVRLPRVLWRVDLGGDITGTPAVVGNAVYVGAYNGQVAALEAASGAPIWSVNLDGEKVSGSLAVSGGRVFVPTLSGNLWALSQATGATLWKADLTFGMSRVTLYGSPVLANGSLYLGVSSEQAASTSQPDFRGSVVSIDPATGALRWTSFLASGAEYGAGVWVTPAVYGGQVFTGTGQALAKPITRYSDAMLALDASDGSIEWFKQWWPNDAFRFLNPLGGPDYDISGSPQIFWVGPRMMVGAGSKSGDYHAMDATTGLEVWSGRYSNGSPIGGILASTAYARGRIHAVLNNLISQKDGRPVLLPTVGNYTTIAAANGSVLHSTVGLPSFSAPCVAGGVVYYSDVVGTILARRADTGALLWALPTLEPSASGPAVSRGRLYIGTGAVSSIAGSITGMDENVLSHHLLSIAIDGT